MPDDKLTEFLVALCTDEKIYKKFATSEADRDELMKMFQIPGPTATALVKGFAGPVRLEIGTQQGGGKSRAMEANQLAKKASALVKAAVDLLGETSALAKALGVKVEDSGE